MKMQFYLHVNNKPILIHFISFNQQKFVYSIHCLFFFFFSPWIATNCGGAFSDWLFALIWPLGGAKLLHVHVETSSEYQWSVVSSGRCKSCV